MNKETVAIVETSGWGGICHYAFQLANFLGKRNMNIQMISAKDYELRDDVSSFSLHEIWNKNDSYYSKILQLYKIIHQLKPQILHFQSIFSPRRDWLFFALLKALRYKIVFTVHNVLPHDEFEQQAKGLKTGFRIIYNLVDHIILHSQANKKEFLELFPMSQKKISVIPMGNYNMFKSSDNVSKEIAKKKLGYKQNERIILFFGAIRPYKGVEYLINAFTKIETDFPDARLLIAGKPIALNIDELRNRIGRLNIENKTKVIAEYIPNEEIENYLSSAEFVVFPYVTASQSASVFLAYAYSKPVIVTQVGGLPEIVEHKKSGLIVPPEDVRNLSDALKEFLSLAPNKLNRMGKYARKLTETKFGWEEIADRTQDVYKKI